jgi:uncharacterized protein
MNSMNLIQECVSGKKVAIAGISRKKGKFGNTIFNELRKRNYVLLPLHPELSNFENIACVKSINELTEIPDLLVLVTKPTITLSLIQQAENKGITRFWIQQGAEDEKVLQHIKANQLQAVTGECLLMFLDNPMWIHRIHACINRIIGKYPK